MKFAAIVAAKTTRQVIKYAFPGGNKNVGNTDELIKRVKNKRIAPKTEVAIIFDLTAALLPSRL